MVGLLGRVAAPLALIVTTALLGACAGPAVAPVSSTQAAPLATIPATAVATVPPAELWQYRTTDCVLNLFFYHEAGVYRLLSAESWTRASAASAAPVPCRAAGAPVDAHTAL